MFRGRYHHQMDAKGRVSVPSRFRELLTAGSDGRVIVTNFDACLWAYTLPDWQELERKVAALPQFKEEVKALQRVFISAAAECPIDRQGRILVPPSLRDYAGLGRDVVIVGMTRRFELWSRERWEQVFTGAQARLTDMGAALADLGL